MFSVRGFIILERKCKIKLRYFQESCIAIIEKLMCFRQTEDSNLNREYEGARVAQSTNKSITKHFNSKKMWKRAIPLHLHLGTQCRVFQLQYHRISAAFIFFYVKRVSVRWVLVHRAEGITLTYIQT